MGHTRIAATGRSYGRLMWWHATGHLDMTQHRAGQWPELK